MSSFLSLINDKRVRDWIYQIAVVVFLVALTVFFVRNASENMVKAGIASGFDFLWRTSGIEVPFVLTGYTQADNILALFWVGVANTMLVTVIAIVLATALGFVVGIARLSSHWLLSTIAGAYIEFVRNIPLLFFVLFWYFGVIAALPAPRQSISLFGVAFLNNRGVTIPLPDGIENFRVAGLVILACALVFWAFSLWARRRRERTGQQAPTLVVGLALLVAVPLLMLAWATLATRWDVPVLRGFNYRGGFAVIPEFVALLAALVTYTAGFIAEIVRGGIQSVSHGQTEAGSALGLRSGQILRLVTIPQALRVMIPPMTSQYLNVLKNSSFGAAIAYPDVVSLFMGSALNNTGQAIEIIAMTLAVYLVIGLAVSAFMNWYNARIALVTR
ncbi:General L-amino acid transport system permease protein OS=Bosea thiooxidans OX=53254 GN=SAMN05660750_04855 PE=3 SV=1 [Bosea thiooxidans]|uniref:General L-amino acid transport system permease protein n=1 Tax=Bosea thiooxidans TaxID=53254 RepID=A0A1T5H456_9HYPH|nr:ABC transporter permease subunit [Bosea thiooxidans]SKC15467.1 general L-amino acid transport system permease protein [Bosea thiooxidans]